MMIFTCTNFTGHWPVGTAAVIVADNAAQAVNLLKHHLEGIGLPQKEYWRAELETVEVSTAKVIILRDGDY